jgi:hypothetical protein
MGLCHLCKNREALSEGRILIFMARRSSSGNLFVGCVAGGLVLIGIALYLRDRGLLRLPEPTPKAPAQRAEDLAKKYPDAEVFSAPEVDKKKVKSQRP